MGDGSEALTLAFDGVTLCVFVANQFSNTVTKLKASDGSVLGTFQVGNRPVVVVPSIAPSGAMSIWVANNRSRTVTRLQASNGAVLGTFSAGDGPQGLAFDGQNIWVTNERSNSVTYLWVTNNGSGNVMKLDPDTGIVLATLVVGRSPFGVAFDGAHIWVANIGTNTV